MQSQKRRKSPSPTRARLRKLERLERIVGRRGSALVAFSGGADSTFLLSVARDVLEDRAVAATVAFPAVPASEVRAARALARALGVKHVVLRADEILSMKPFAGNAPDRCYHCKKALLAKLAALAARRGLACVLDGSNADDAMEARPGSRAVRELGVGSPLAEAGLTKVDIRALSRERGLPTWDKAATPCLATRIPYGEKVTKARLSRIERGEAALAAAGFRGAPASRPRGCGPDRGRAARRRASPRRAAPREAREEAQGARFSVRRGRSRRVSRGEHGRDAPRAEESLLDKARVAAIIAEEPRPLPGREDYTMHVLRRYRRWILTLGFAAIVAGYIFLALNSISLAPLLLVLGYCVLVPLALL